MDEIHSAHEVQKSAQETLQLNTQTRRRGLKGSLTGRWNKRLFAVLAAAIVAASVFTAVFIYGVRFSYSVSYKGEKLGMVSDKAQAQTVIDNAAASASSVLGYEYDLSGDVEVKLALADKNTALDSKALERAIIDAVPETTRYFGVYINGQLIGGMEDGSAALRLLDEALEAQKSGDAVRAEYLDSIEVVKKYAPTELLMDEAGLKDAIDKSIEDSVLTAEITYSVQHTETIPYETEIIEVPTMEEGQREILTEGRCGSVTRTVEYTLVDGTMTSRRLVDNDITSNAVVETIAVGTMQKPVFASKGTYIWPASGPVTSPFGPRSVSVGSSIHKGIDIGAHYGEPISAADAGEIIYSDYMNGYGYLIQIRHDNGEVTYYAHCSELIAQVGERVDQGQLIAYVGNTGVSSGAHLHFEVRVDGVPVDPQTVLPQ